ncbi:hypothetical protein ASD82_11320 [Rhodanobacter sp. Root179]|uniref:type II toxin-antitoxin system Phd/YefM family antitoxin n=1 Tax=Rhodanobacter sp. Root179 TaxID=1736482 RepID=UPI0006FC7F5F|nr:type II toxin-antitoxin system Phd/YefM family antitoxin [Rhodanobacter sp. Root179]KRB39270.1 hypothetical protein ASD82_11320 [Rhodanobacter sp. Root179]
MSPLPTHFKEDRIRAINLTHARDHLGKVLDQVVDDCEPTIITRRGDFDGKRAVVAVSATKYQAIMNTIDSTIRTDEPQ